MSKLNIQRSRPTDKSDPGFRIPGKKLRWVAAHQTENDASRIWKPVRPTDLPKDVLEKFKARNSEVATNAEWKIRRGDLVLAYASEEEAAELRAENLEKAVDQHSIVRREVESNDMNVEHEAQSVGMEAFKKPGR